MTDEEKTIEYIKANIRSGMPIDRLQEDEIDLLIKKYGNNWKIEVWCETSAKSVEKSESQLYDEAIKKIALNQKLTDDEYHLMYEKHGPSWHEDVKYQFTHDMRMANLWEKIVTNKTIIAEAAKRTDMVRYIVNFADDIVKEYKKRYENLVGE